MGEGPIEDMTQVQINDADIALFSGTSWDWRQGTEDQDVIPGFELATNVWGDGRELPHNGDSSGTNHLIYTTRGADITRVTLIFCIPFLFNLQECTGQAYHAWIDIKVEYRESGQRRRLYQRPRHPFQWQDNRDSSASAPLTSDFPTPISGRLTSMLRPRGGGQNQVTRTQLRITSKSFPAPDTSNYP